MQLKYFFGPKARKVWWGRRTKEPPSCHAVASPYVGIRVVCRLLPNVVILGPPTTQDRSPAFLCIGVWHIVGD